MKSAIKLLGGATILLSLIVSCTKDKSPISSNLECTETIFYSSQIKPLIEQNCSTSGCHDASTSAAGYQLTSYQSISSNSEIILRAIKHQNGVEPMPLGGTQLNDSLIQQFECWILQGKPEN